MADAKQPRESAKARARRIYVTERLTEIGKELAAARAERQTLAAQVKSKDQGHRKSFLTTKIAMLIAERKTLTEERKLGVVANANRSSAGR